MRKTITLALVLLAVTALLGWLVDPRLFVLTAYVALIFGPVVAVGLIYNHVVSVRSSHTTWPPRLHEGNHDWPADLNPDRKSDDVDVMW